MYFIQTSKNGQQIKNLENVKSENSTKMQDRLLTKEDYPDLPGTWMWESEYILLKEFCKKLEEKWNKYIFQKDDGRLQ